ncbi:hypothetical protein SAMN05660242_2502 [Thermoanaerobacterium sp. RBIITD]|nr:hypothetical protein SAMN05660242_2502 [Thermoanaerobacterium sp. RBIITD]
MINFDDNKIIAYIAEGMKNEYIRLSKKNVKIKENEFFILDDKEIIVDNFEYENIENKIFVQEALNKLTPLQKKDNTGDNHIWKKRNRYSSQIEYITASGKQDKKESFRKNEKVFRKKSLRIGC